MSSLMVSCQLRVSPSQPAYPALADNSGPSLSSCVCNGAGMTRQRVLPPLRIPMAVLTLELH